MEHNYIDMEEDEPKEKQSFQDGQLIRVGIIYECNGCSNLIVADPEIEVGTDFGVVKDYCRDCCRDAPSRKLVQTSIEELVANDRI